jgi:imidazole glycerol-phosphate synthase subunit HisH
MRNVIIVNYEAGNLFSVEHACKSIGLNPIVTNWPEDILNADALILPGVGAFGDAMNNLHKLDLVRPIREFAASGKPFMGICLGMQLLFSRSREFGDHCGLNLIEGEVVRFPASNAVGVKMKVPHMGWNRISRPSQTGRMWNGTPLDGIVNGEFMYFVHSYYACPMNSEDVLSVTDYEGVKYCSSVIKDNLFATQFHPEKSAQEGIKIYQCWANNIG